MPAFTHLESILVSDQPPNTATPGLRGYLDQWLRCEWSEAIDHSEECTLVAPYTPARWALLQARRVVTLISRPPEGGNAGALRFFRITEPRREWLAGGATQIVVVARSLALDLTDTGPLATLFAGGTPTYIQVGTLHSHDWLTQFIVPHLARQGYGFYVAGALVNAQPVHASFTRWTARQLWEHVLQEIGWEWQLIPVGATFVVAPEAAVNGTLSPLRIGPGANLQRLVEKRPALEMATILAPQGEAGWSETTQSLAHFTMLGSVVDTALKTFRGTLAFVDDGGVSLGMVWRSGQFVDASGVRSWYLYRIKTGRSFRIVSTTGVKDTGVDQLTLAELTDALYGNEYELREAATPVTLVSVPVPGIPLRVQSVASPTIVLNDPLNNGDPVPTDDVHGDCRLVVSPQVLATTCSNIANVAGSTTEQDLTLASVAGVAAGHWGFLHNNVAVPWTLFGKVFTVVSVDGPGSKIRVRIRYTYEPTAFPFTPGATSKQCQVYAPRAVTPFVDDEVASTNTLTLNSTATIVANDLIEYQLENAGALLTGLPSPAFGAYPLIRKDQAFSGFACYYNLAWNSNPYFDSWAGAANQPPTLWVLTIGQITRLTTNLPGPGTVFAAGMLSGSIMRSTIPLFASVTSGDSKISARTRLRTPPLASEWTGAQNIKLALVQPTIGTTLANVILVPSDHPSPPAGSIVVAHNTLVTLDLLNVDLLAPLAGGATFVPRWHGVVPQIENFAGGTVAVGGVVVVRDGTLPPDEAMTPSGKQQLWTLTQLALDEIREPAQVLEVDGIDLAKLLLAQYGPGELVKGRPVILEADALGLTVQDRLAAIEYRADAEGQVTMRIRTEKASFADVLAAQLTALQNA